MTFVPTAKVDPGNGQFQAFHVDLPIPPSTRLTIRIGWEALTAFSSVDDIEQQVLAQCVDSATYDKPVLDPLDDEFNHRLTAIWVMIHRAANLIAADARRGAGNVVMLPSWLGGVIRSSLEVHQMNHGFTLLDSPDDSIYVLYVSERLEVVDAPAAQATVNGQLMGWINPNASRYVRRIDFK